jgi:hypothetical protein
MPNPTHRGNDERIAAPGADGARLMVQKAMIPRRMAVPGLVAKRSPQFELPLRKPLDHHEPDTSQPRHDAQAAEDRRSGLERETSFLAGLLRLTGAAVGFVMGGPAGAVLGSAAGNIVAERSNSIWRKLRTTSCWRARHASNGRQASAVDANRSPQDR